VIGDETPRSRFGEKRPTIYGKFVREVEYLIVGPGRNAFLRESGSLPTASRFLRSLTYAENPCDSN
jgi:hypothetical protein